MIAPKSAREISRFPAATRRSLGGVHGIRLTATAAPASPARTNRRFCGRFRGRFSFMTPANQAECGFLTSPSIMSQRGRVFQANQRIDLSESEIGGVALPRQKQTD